MWSNELELINYIFVYCSLTLQTKFHDLTVHFEYTYFFGKRDFTNVLESIHYEIVNILHLDNHDKILVKLLFLLSLKDLFLFLFAA